MKTMSAVYACHVGHTGEGDGNTDVGQRRRVVDAVAHKGNRFSAVLQLLDDLHLAFGEGFSVDVSGAIAQFPPPSPLPPC